MGDSISWLILSCCGKIGWGCRVRLVLYSFIVCHLLFCFSVIFVFSYQSRLDYDNYVHQTLKPLGF